MKNINIESIDHMLGIASQFIINSTTTSFDAQMNTLNSDCNDYTRKLNTLQNSAENLVDPKAVASQILKANPPRSRKLTSNPKNFRQLMHKTNRLRSKAPQTFSKTLQMVF